MSRKEVIAWFLDYLNMLQPGNKNIEKFTIYFDSLSDIEFSELMKKLKSGEVILPYTSPNLKEKDVSIEAALAVGDKLGIKFFQQIKIVDHKTGVCYLSPDEYLILYLPVRRQSQHVSKGKSVAENSSFTDTLTGQPTGPSNTTQITLPEIMNLEAVGLHEAIKELISVRGGNELAFRKAKRDTLETGSYKLSETDKTNSRATSIDTLKSFLLGMHLDNNL
jgi:hypothetical protein